MDPDNNLPEVGLQIISPVFRDGSAIPPQYTCKGQNVNPPLNIFNVPPKAQSLALVMHDPDAPSGDYTHWLVWDIPTSIETIIPNSIPVGAAQGTNDSGAIGYMGPCPPPATGPHRYVFDLYALDTSLGLESGQNRQQLVRAMQGHVLVTASLTGLFNT